jgi:glyoxylase-like metal-dependent hydrolase (beta-lactamase superfamily II)
MLTGKARPPAGEPPGEKGATYTILALKYAGPVASSKALVLWFREWDEIVERSYYFWCLQDGTRTVLVDTGVSPQALAGRRLPGYTSPAELLAGIGIAAEEIQHVILTHLHWDHAGGVDLFPNAAFYVQRQEYLFWVENPVSHRPPLRAFTYAPGLARLQALQGSGRLILLDGDSRVLPGISCLLAPGHTPALQAVAVNTRAGTAVLGSDCAHMFENYQREWPSCIITDLPAWLETYSRLKSAVSHPDLLFPGHDPRMSSDYPRLASDITRLS